jgi:hypothetical protein
MENSVQIRSIALTLILILSISISSNASASCYTNLTAMWFAAMVRRREDITPGQEEPENLGRTSTVSLRRRPARAERPRAKMARGYIKAPMAKIATRAPTATDVIEAQFVIARNPDVEGKHREFPSVRRNRLIVFCLDWRERLVPKVSIL